MGNFLEAVLPLGGTFTSDSLKSILLLGLDFPTSGFFGGVSGNLFLKTLLVFLETKSVPLQAVRQMYGLNLLPVGAERIPFEGSSSSADDEQEI